MNKDIFKDKEKIKDVFKKLPDELKSYILSFENTQKISGIIIENELPQEIQPELSFLISLVLTGINDKKEFEDNLKEHLGMDSLLASKIYIQVDRGIFYPVKKLIKQARDVFEKEIESEKEEEKKEEIEEKKEEEEKKEKKLEEEGKISPKRFKWETIKKKVSPKVILGKEEEVKPTLETTSPLTSIFKEVKPEKEKIVSSLEIEKKEEKKEEKILKGIDFGGIFSKIKKTFKGEEVKETDKKIEEEKKEKKIEEKPVKIVNFSAEEIKPEMKLEKEQEMKPEIKMERMRIMGREEGEEEKEIGKVDKKKDDDKIELKKLKF